MSKADARRTDLRGNEIVPASIRIYFSYDYTKDRWRHTSFLKQAQEHSEFRIRDVSLPQAIHDQRWQKEALQRIQTADLMILLLGEDTHTARGVHDEMSIAGQCNCPISQIRPRKKQFHAIGQDPQIVAYRWSAINELLSKRIAT